MKPFVIILALFMSGQCISAPLGLEQWRKFDVEIEIIPEALNVNGVPIVIHRAVGRGVAALAEAIQRQWIQEVGFNGVRADAGPGWAVSSRLKGDALEVIQWRVGGTEPELLWSKSDLAAGILSAPDTLLGLPHGCMPGTTLHGRVDTGVYLQRTARCASTARAILSAMKASAIRNGYAVRPLDGMLVAHRRNIEIVVVVEHARGPRSSGKSELVYLQVDRETKTP